MVVGPVQILPIPLTLNSHLSSLLLPQRRSVKQKEVANLVGIGHHFTSNRPMGAAYVPLGLTNVSFEFNLKSIVLFYTPSKQ